MNLFMYLNVKKLICFEKKSSEIIIWKRFYSDWKDYFYVNFKKKYE